MICWKFHLKFHKNHHKTRMEKMRFVIDCMPMSHHVNIANATDSNAFRFGKQFEYSWFDAWQFQSNSQLHELQCHLKFCDDNYGLCLNFVITLSNKSQSNKAKSISDNCKWWHVTKWILNGVKCRRQTDTHTHTKSESERKWSSWLTKIEHKFSCSVKCFMVLIKWLKLLSLNIRSLFSRIQLTSLSTLSHKHTHTQTSYA